MLTKKYLSWAGVRSLEIFGLFVKQAMGARWLAVIASCGLILQGVAQSAGRNTVQAEPGARWHMKGEGMVCCPCKTPCPCRNNGRPNYGHCEATLYLKIRSGSYNSVDMSGMHVVETGGMCATNYKHLSALYFERGTPVAQQSAYMKIIADISPDHVAEFPHVRTVPMQIGSDGPAIYSVVIPGLLTFKADRNWGQATPPMPMVAGPDTLSNEVQYARNLKYRMHDEDAGLDFDYSGRQANYRTVDLDQDRYAHQAMLIQLADGSGWFNAAQLHLIESQKLTLPNLDALAQEAIRLRKGGAE